MIVEDLAGTGHVAIDVGASIGLWSHRLSKVFAKVEAFEPIAECAEELEAFGRKNITIHNVGLSSVNGKHELHIPVASSVGCGTFGSLAEDHRTISVPIRTLDSYNFTDVDFIKIDVEGHELDVLRGAKTTISREKPTMVIEIEQRHLAYDMDIVFDTILGFGYEAFILHEGKLHSYTKPSGKDNRATPLNNNDLVGYSRNFIFKPISKTSLRKTV